MELTRRDAVVVLALTGAGAGVSGRLVEQLDDDPFAESVAALAGTVYPSAIELDGEFVRTYLAGRLEAERAEYAYVMDAFDTLDEHAMRLYSREFTDIGVGRREDVLRDLGVDAATAERHGSVPERIRYLVDELLFVLYTSPTGGRLVGNENPAGHPGGLESYQQEP